MPVAIRSVTRIQDQDDGPGTLGAAQDGKGLVWDNDTGAFVILDHAKTIHVAAVGGTSVTLLADGDDDVTAILSVLATIKVSDGNTDAGITYCPNSGSTNLYDDGTNVLRLVVAADGGVTLQRTAGTVTFDAALTMNWL